MNSKNIQVVMAFSVGAAALIQVDVALGNLRVENNPPPFVEPEAPIYYEPQDLSAPSAVKFREKTVKILAEAGNPTDDLKRAMALCDWIINKTMIHPYFHKEFKRKVHDPVYDTMAHDPVMILEYTEKFLPVDPETWPAPECTMQADVFVGLMNTLGYHGRVLNIQGHVASEYFSPSLRKWVYVDTSFNEFYEKSGASGVPLSVLEARDLTLAGQEASLVPVKCGPSPKNYIQIYPKGFGVLYSPLMWEANFDQKSKTNKKPNMLVFGDSDIPFFKPYPKTTRREDVDFPLGLVRVASATEKNSAAQVILENCIPCFSHYEKQLSGGTWEKLKNATDTWPIAKGVQAAYRGVDNAGFASPVVVVMTP
ncbi:MAG: hypothetical protein HY360_03725 [Verrucomicrobia bacterium]|nr:hypothetical protein [Verrucomicrobiota bacterium]